MTHHISLARRLVADLAERLDIPEMLMNEAGEAVLEYEGREVYLMADARLSLLHVYAPVRSLYEDAPELETVLEALLEANLFADRLADGWFAWSRELEQVILNSRIMLNGLPDDRLDKPLDDFLRVYQASLDAFSEDEPVRP